MSTFLAPISKDITKVLDYIDRYESACLSIEPFFTLDGKKLLDICNTLPRKTLEFKQYDAELKSIIELLELKKSKVEGEKWKTLLEHNARHLASKDIQQYIKGDAEYVDISELIVEISHVRNKVNSVIEALDIMHWQLNNSTKLAVASLEDFVI